MKTKITIIILLTFTLATKAQNLQVFDTFSEFQTAVTNSCSTTSLTNETFDNVNIDVSLCQVPVLPDPNQLCFTSNEFENGYTIQGASQVSMVAFAQNDFGANPINIVGPNNNIDTVLIDFSPSVSAVSFSTWQLGNNPSSFDIRVYGEMNELLGSYNRDSSTSGLYSFHVISDEPISRIETNGNVATGITTAGILIGDLHFGASNCVTPILIPDSNFEQLLVNLNYDDMVDGSVVADNINTVTTLDISSSDISDLTGIAGFTALEEFTSVNNPLTTIDLSNNTNLNSVIVNNNAQLTTLNLKNGFNNRNNNNVLTLSTLDATNNVSLLCIEVDNVAAAESNPNWTKDPSTVYSTDCELTLSINSNEIDQLISIYPNPVKDILTISYPDKIEKIEIYNLIGKKILTKTDISNSIPMDGLKSGIYILKIETNFGTAIKKIIKE